MSVFIKGGSLASTVSLSSLARRSRLTMMPGGYAPIVSS
jgi:hypothetical protein